jgi:signal transduction histidine kinase
MGLGLAVVKSTVERHRGTVQIEDSSPHGARFVVRLPAA